MAGWARDAAYKYNNNRGSEPLLVALCLLGLQCKEAWIAHGHGLRVAHVLDLLLLGHARLAEGLAATLAVMLCPETHE